ncbi:MAG: EthD domain-containing protein [Acidimicrobiia bacterium]
MIVAVGWDAPGPSPDAPATVRRAVADQGPYARGNPFAWFVVDPTDALDVAAVGAPVWAWTVEEHVPRAGSAACALAMVSLMRRNPALMPAEFAAHWRTRHAPLALRRHEGLADYHQYVVTGTLTPAAPAIDGVALLGFRTRADFETRFFDSDEGRAEIMEDVARFMDRPGPETTLVGPAEPARTHG